MITPGVLFIVFPKQTLNNISKFCIEPRRTISQLVIDKTFVVGPFTSLQLFISAQIFNNMMEQGHGYLF